MAGQSARMRCWARLMIRCASRAMLRPETHRKYSKFHRENLGKSVKISVIYCHNIFHWCSWKQKYLNHPLVFDNLYTMNMVRFFFAKWSDKPSQSWTWKQCLGLTLHSLLMLLLGPEPFEKLFPWSYPQLGNIPQKRIGQQSQRPRRCHLATHIYLRFFGFELDWTSSSDETLAIHWIVCFRKCRKTCCDESSVHHLARHIRGFFGPQTWPICLGLGPKNRDA